MQRKAKLFEHQRRLRYTEKWQYLESLRTFSAEQHWAPDVLVGQSIVFADRCIFSPETLLKYHVTSQEEKEPVAEWHAFGCDCC